MTVIILLSTPILTQSYDLAYGKYNDDVAGARKQSVVIWDFEYVYPFCDCFTSSGRREPIPVLEILMESA